MKVALMITCLADTLRPNVGKSVVRLLRKLGCEVTFPTEQTCCGQPFYNSGFTSQAADVARRTLRVFREPVPVVVPSGSCAAMVRLEYPHLFPDEPELRTAAEELAGRTYEFAEFLVRKLGVSDVGAKFPGKVTYHPSCHLRGLGTGDCAETLLRHVAGAEVVPLPGREQCCGFGGSFAVRYHEISQAMVSAKAGAIRATEAAAVVSADTGCLMNIEGRLRRTGGKVEVLHLAELLDPARTA